VAVGIGVALAQAERARRSTKAKRARERRFAQLPGEQLGEGLQRMALGQLDLAIELLTDERQGERHRHGHRNTPDERAIHETRKALKRLRALLRLLREELGERRFAREDALLRDAGRSLAGARDAEVVVNTLDALLDRSPAKLASRRAVTELRKLLVAEREAAARRTLGDGAARAEVRRELIGLRERAQRWSLPERPGIAVVESDLQRVYREGRRRHRRAGRSVIGDRGKGGARALHEWRKRVKDLRYAAEILNLRPLAHRADTLGELLGEEHDLALLAALLPPPGRGPFKGKRGKQSRKALLKQIARRRRRLRKRALREGERLYRRRPKRFTQRARRAHARVSRG
jgi:CHAD domain-containing protein